MIFLVKLLTKSLQLLGADKIRKNLQLARFFFLVFIRYQLKKFLKKKNLILLSGKIFKLRLKFFFNHIFTLKLNKL